jgi:hypothetical protein
MQMAQNIRRYKGVRPMPESKGFSKIKLDGNFSDWDDVVPEFRDTKGDITHRDSKGYGGLHYINNSGRNDIVISKAAVDGKNISFYVETAQPLTSEKEENWMLLLIDADNNSSTGWYGYDYIINKEVKSSNLTTLKRYDTATGEWSTVAEIPYIKQGNKMELSIPLKSIGLNNKRFVIDFKWADNPKELVDPISLCTDGDTAPNRRFNYRFSWKK